jgi:hypothetical protein
LGTYSNPALSVIDPATHAANDGQYTSDQQKNQRFTHTSALWRELLVPGSEKSLSVWMRSSLRDRQFQLM